jgi:hypothetical protein
LLLLAVLRLALRVLHLVGNHSITWAMPLVLKLHFWLKFLFSVKASIICHLYHAVAHTAQKKRQKVLRWDVLKKWCSVKLINSTDMQLPQLHVRTGPWVSLLFTKHVSCWSFFSQICSFSQLMASLFTRIFKLILKAALVFLCSVCYCVFL